MLNQNKRYLSIAFYQGKYRIIGTVYNQEEWDLFKNGFDDYHQAREAIKKYKYELFKP